MPSSLRTLAVVLLSVTAIGVGVARIAHALSGAGPDGSQSVAEAARVAESELITETFDGLFTLDGEPVAIERTERTERTIDGKAATSVFYVADYQDKPEPFAFSQLYAIDGSLAVVITLTSDARVHGELTGLANRIFEGVRYLDR